MSRPDEIEWVSLQSVLDRVRGCHDYNGGYHEPETWRAFHHGIDTVLNVLSADPREGQIRVVEQIGREERVLRALLDVLAEIDDDALARCYDLRADSTAPLDVALFAWRRAGCPR